MRPDDPTATAAEREAQELADAIRPAWPDSEWEQVNYFLAPVYRVVEEDDGWRVFKRVDQP